jgi:hypothetical protein
MSVDRGAGSRSSDELGLARWVARLGCRSWHQRAIRRGRRTGPICGSGSPSATAWAPRFSKLADLREWFAFYDRLGASVLEARRSAGMVRLLRSPGRLGPRSRKPRSLQRLEWGMLNGKLSALRSVGNEWDVSTPEGPDTSTNRCGPLLPSMQSGSGGPRQRRFSSRLQAKAVAQGG